ncbi:MAG: aa3-type cytochrome c oxidase subunit IV [Xanthobacteraceae bacterium]
MRFNTTADGNDYRSQQTYLGFVALVKWATISLAVILHDVFLPGLIARD